MYSRIACTFLLISSALTLPAQDGVKIEKEPAQEPAQVRKVAILPWVLKDGTDTAVETAQTTITKLFEGVNYEVISSVRAKAVWEEEMKMAPIKIRPESKDPYPELPKPSDLLELGKKLGVDIVCAGRAKWHTRSIWVGLGPKTKADCNVDLMIIDVAKEEIILDAQNVKSDSTRKEAALESFGALFIAGGITMVSGGPKTPHQQRAAQNAITKAMEPWLQVNAKRIRKISDKTP